jgi:purine-nucleoside phosphorylase
MFLSEFLNRESIKLSVQHLKQSCFQNIHTAVILGSFLSSSTSFFPWENKQEIPMEEIPGYPLPSVTGHLGRIILGSMHNKLILVFGGRVHYYEGYGHAEVLLPVMIAHRLGARQLILTNSAGGLNSEFKQDDIMLITDHINLTGDNPLFGYRYQSSQDYFLDMSYPYSPNLLQLARKAGRQLGLNLKNGVYAGLKGPSLETRAEAKRLQLAGADAVGMSTVTETIMARYLGLEVLGISHIRNLANQAKFKYNHSEGKKKETKIGKILSNLMVKVIEWT